MHLKSIQLKIALLAGACLLLSAAVLVGYSLKSTHDTQVYVDEKVSALLDDGAKLRLEQSAKVAAKNIQQEFDVAMNAARTMAQTFEMSKQLDDEGRPLLQLDRSAANAILLNVLKHNESFNGTYSCWEPDALDGRDSDFRVQADGNNPETGRFTPYWTRDDKGRVDVQPLVEYDTDAVHPNGVAKGDGIAARKRIILKVSLAPCRILFRVSRSGWPPFQCRLCVMESSMVLPEPTMFLILCKSSARRLMARCFQGRGK